MAGMNRGCKERTAGSYKRGAVWKRARRGRPEQACFCGIGQAMEPSCLPPCCTKFLALGAGFPPTTRGVCPNRAASAVGRFPGRSRACRLKRLAVDSVARHARTGHGYVPSTCLLVVSPTPCTQVDPNNAAFGHFQSQNCEHSPLNRPWRQLAEGSRTPCS